MRGETGFGLMEFLVSVLIMALVMAGLAKTLSTETRAQTQQDLAVMTEQNLRVAMDTLVDTLRVAGDRVPTANLSVWIPWVEGFSSNPQIGSLTPATISVARSSPLPVATLSTQAPQGATLLNVASAVPGTPVVDLLDTYSRRLVVIDELGNAHVTSVAESYLTVDTDPATSGSQGLERAYPAGTPIFRVDVLTFSIETDPTTGVPQLTLDQNQDDPPQAVAEGISNLEITQLAAPSRYEISLTAQSEKADPLTGEVLARSLTSQVTARNLRAGGGS